MLLIVFKEPAAMNRSAIIVCLLHQIAQAIKQSGSKSVAVYSEIIIQA